MPCPAPVPRRRQLLLAATTLLLAGCASTPPEEIAPGGTLRVAIDYSRPLLARPGNANQPVGPAADMAREIGRQLGQPVALISFDTPAAVAKALQDRSVDLAFVSADPTASRDPLHSFAWITMDGALLVREDSPLQRSNEIDREGLRVVVTRGSAEDQHLGRILKAATVVRAATAAEAARLFVSGQIDVLAGPRVQLQAETGRLLLGSFMRIDEVIALPPGRGGSRRWLDGVVEQAKAVGFVEDSLKRHRVEGVEVASPGR